jgi:hypothetical protein
MAKREMIPAGIIFGLIFVIVIGLIVYLPPVFPDPIVQLSLMLIILFSAMITIKVTF